MEESKPPDLCKLLFLERSVENVQSTLCTLFTSQFANPVSSQQLIECLESLEGSRSNAAPDPSLFVWQQLITYQKTDRDGWLVEHEMHWVGAFYLSGKHEI